MPHTASSALNADVVVVGAGPVGMTAAGLLAARGVSVLVLERNLATSDEPKAISLDDEALRVYQASGMVDRILRVIVPGVGTRYYDVAGVPVLRAGSERPVKHGYPFKNSFAQPDLEREMHAQLVANHLVTVRMGWVVTDLRQEGRTVEVTSRCTSTGRVERVRARYVLGCDGGRSTVRDVVGIGMTGRSHDTPWLVADVLDDGHDERYGMHYADPSRPHVIMPGRGGRCRYEFLLHPGEGTPTDVPDLALVRRLLAPYRKITPNQIERSVIYTFHSLIADHWRVGRVFLLGDAAHMMPPFAGQGLNSGIRDAANLTWKIADVIAGRLTASALDSYETERRPHAVATVRLSERLGRLVMTTNRRLAARRDAHFAAVLADPGKRAYYEQMRYRPPHVYPAGMLVANGAVPVGTMIGQPHVFDTAASQTRLLDDAIGPGWALLGIGVTQRQLADGRAGVAAVAPRAVHVAIDDRFPRGDANAVIDLDGRLDAEFHAYRGRLVLVRPDRFVAASWLPGQAPPLHPLHLSGGRTEGTDPCHTPRTNTREPVGSAASRPGRPATA